MGSFVNGIAVYNFPIIFERGAFASAFFQSNTASSRVDRIVHLAKSLYNFTVNGCGKENTTQGAYWI